VSTVTVNFKGAEENNEKEVRFKFALHQTHLTFNKVKNSPVFFFFFSFFILLLIFSGIDYL